MDKKELMRTLLDMYERQEMVQGKATSYIVDSHVRKLEDKLAIELMNRPKFDFTPTIKIDDYLSDSAIEDMEENK